MTLDEILMLVGRLDDTPGFDTPRERLRRFLTDRLTNANLVRELIEQDHHTMSEQHHRALQDIAVWLGHFLGFEPIFGTYHRIAGAVRYDGQWRSRHGAHLVLEIRSDQAPRTDLDDLSRSLAALSATEQLEPDTRALGLVVLMPPYVARGRLDDLLSARNLRVAKVHALLWLADRLTAGRISHDEVIRLLGTGFGLDFIVDLVDRFSAFTWPVPASGLPPEPGESANEFIVKTPASEPSPPPEPPGPGFWLATIDSDENAEPEQFVESVIGKRHIFAVEDEGDGNGSPGPEDWICFFIPDVGVVGHAQIEAASRARPELIRDSSRFRQLFHLKNPQIYVGDPVVLLPRLSPDATAQRPTGVDSRDFRLHRGSAGAQRLGGPQDESTERRHLIRISRREFEMSIGYKSAGDAVGEEQETGDGASDLDANRS